MADADVTVGDEDIDGDDGRRGVQLRSIDFICYSRASVAGS